MSVTNKIDQFNLTTIKIKILFFKFTSQMCTMRILRTSYDQCDIILITFNIS